MATPHVAGACALLWGYSPNMTHTNVKSCILDNVVPIAALTDITVTCGRLNAFNALTCSDIPEPPPSCGDLFTDSGGEDGSYQNNEQITTIICPDSPGETVTVTFTAFDVEVSSAGACQDKLIVYNGDSNTTPYIGEYCGEDNSSIPGPFVSTHASGCLTFEFTSDESIVKDGWNALVGCIVPGACRNRDSLALVALYNSTNGSNWATGWNLNQPMDTWYGVTMADGCVSELILFFNNLTGTLPDELGDLDNLITLDLSYNTIGGAIPNALGDLVNLEWLSLDNNNLSGSIPVGLGAAPNLFYLGLGENNLTGTIPADLGLLNQLLILHLPYNNLDGSIPESLGQLTSLSSLFLNDNNLSGAVPESISSLPNLVRITLQNNNLTFAGIETLSNAAIGVQEYAPQDLISLQLSDGIFSVDAGGTLSKNTYRWYRDGVLVQTITGNNSYTPTEAGLYCCEITNADATIPADPLTNLILKTEAVEYAGSQVWPGDFNDDGTAAPNDLMYWGLANGNVGPPRATTSIAWMGYDAADWNIEVRGINGKFQDGNGDGMVDGLDRVALIQNMGFIHSTRVTDIASIDGGNYTLTKLPLLQAGVLRYAVNLDNNDVPVQTHGFAFTICFGNLSVSDATLNISNSCLELDPQYQIINYKAYDNCLDVALTRTDKNNRPCGELGILEIIIDGDLPVDSPISIRASPGERMTGTADLYSAVGGAYEGLYTEVGASDLNMLIDVTSTPEQCNQMGTATVNVEGGISPYAILWSTGHTTTTVDDLPAGNYTVTVTSSNNLTEVMNINVGGLFIPIYDGEGNLITCEGSTCPQVISLVNQIPTGTHQAAEIIQANGKILSGDNTVLQAGNAIILDAGFTVEQGGELEIKMESCN